MAFSLHPQLVADTIDVGSLTLSRVQLMNDARFPWLILVPKRHAVSEIIDLATSDQSTLLREITAVSHAIRKQFNPDKLNVATLGNIVPQLHIHIVARFAQDPAWPGPVWGVDNAEPYDESAAKSLSKQLATTLNISA